MSKCRRVVSVVGLLAALLLPAGGQAAEAGRAPCAMAASADGKRLYLAETLGQRVTVFDTEAKKTVAEIPLGAEASGLALSPDGSRLFVTAQVPGLVLVLDTKAAKVINRLPVGYGAMAPVITADGNTLTVCNEFDNDVSVLDAHSGKLKGRVPVVHFPVSAAATKDGAKLFVGNLTSTGPADAPTVFTQVSVLDLAALKSVATVDLPDGSHSLRGIAVSPDDSTVYVSHILARYHQPTTQLERGWMNTNALSVLDAKTNKRINSVLLDDVDRGAANPWAVACLDKQVLVTHAGTHELSVIDPAGLKTKLEAAAKKQKSPTADDGGESGPAAEDVPDDLTFLRVLRKRVPLPLNGPRCLAVAGNSVWVAGFFSDTLAQYELDGDVSKAPASYKLGADQALSIVRKGEMNFSDASLCFQNWQSCVSCHPDTRADGLNWDLLNDGIGNPKNTRTMVNAYQVHPVMSMGVRDSFKTAVRSGIRFIQFAVRPEEDAETIDAYLTALRPLPSPKLVDGKLSPAAKRGEKLFNDKKVACASCHNGPVYTDMKSYDLKTGTGIDADKPFITTRLTECWRTAPYLHDGRASTMVDMLTKFNPGDKHGVTSHLTPAQIADLAEYVLSL